MQSTSIDARSAREGSPIRSASRSRSKSASAPTTARAASSTRCLRTGARQRGEVAEQSRGDLLQALQHRPVGRGETSVGFGRAQVRGQEASVIGRRRTVVEHRDQGLDERAYERRQVGRGAAPAVGEDRKPACVDRRHPLLEQSVEQLRARTEVIRRCRRVARPRGHGHGSKRKTSDAVLGDQSFRGVEQRILRRDRCRGHPKI